MLGAFTRLGESVLRRLGQDASLLQGATTTACRANLERGVQVTGMNADATFVRDVMTLPSALRPRIGDTVTLDGTDYTLDGLLADNGALIRFTVQPA